MTPESNQEQHEKLIDLLNQYYKNKRDEKPPFLSKVKKARFSNSYHLIDSNDINSGVVVFLDVLNLNAGSVGDVDLYELLQAYLGKPECRAQINTIVHNALFGKRT